MDKLKRWMEQTETTQEALAKRVGMRQNTVSDWLRGKTEPTFENLRKLKKITGLTADELIG